MYECTSNPCRSLSEVGLEAIETFELTKDYPTRRVVIEGVETFLERAYRSINPSILWLVGEWGEGKTAIYQGLLRSRRDLYSVYIVASRLFDYMEKILEEQRIWAPNAFLLSLLYTMKDSFDEYSELFKELDELDLTHSLPALLVKLYTYVKEKTGKDPIIVFFIDEFEDIVSRLTTSRGIRLLSAVLEALVELVNGNVEALSKAGLQGKIHFVIATTSSAERVLETRLEVSDIWGRLKRRFNRVEFTRMLSIEVVDHLRKLVDYVYCGKNLGYSHIANPPTLLNFTQISSIGLPAATERILNQLSSILSSRGKIRCNGGSEKLTLENAFEVLGTLKTVVEGEEEQVLIEDNFLLERRNCIDILRNYVGDKEYIEPLCSLILLSRGGIRVEYLKKLGVDNTALTVLEHLGIITTGTGLKLKTSIVEFLNNVRTILAGLKEKYLEGIVGISKPTSMLEGLELYRLLLDNLVYIGDDGSIVLFKPKNTSVLRKIYVEFNGLDEVVASKLAELVFEVYNNLLLEGVVEDYGDIIIVDHGIQNRIFFSQEIATLDFISSREERIRLWRKAKSIKSVEPFLKGILIPVIDVLTGYFSGSSRRDMFSIRIESIGGEYPVASITVTSSVREGKPYIIREFKAQYTPRLRVDLLVVTGNVKPVVLDEYYKLVREKEVYRRPHVVIVFSTGVLYQKVEDLRRKLERLGIPLIVYSVKTIDYLRLSALGIFSEERWGRDIVGYLNSMLNALRGKGEPIGLNIYAYQSYVITRFEREYGLDDMVSKIDGVLKEFGILVPLPRRTVKIGLEELGVSDLYESARSLRWLVHYPTPIVNKSIKELFEYVTSNVRQHMVFGGKYREVIGLDLETPDDLVNKLAPLRDYGIIELKPSSNGDYEVTLRVGDSRLVNRLVSVLANGEARLDEVLEAFVAKGDSPDVAIGVFLEALRSLNLISVNADGIVYLNARYDVLERKLRTLREYLREYIEYYGEIQDKLGYIVSGKVRHNPPWNPGYRYTYTPKLVENISSILDSTSKILRPNLSMEVYLEIARRLASIERILLDIIYHRVRGEENIRYHSVIIDYAFKEYKSARKVLEEIESKLKTLTSQLERLLVDHVFNRSVRIENKYIDRVMDALKELDKVFNSVIGLEEFANSVKSLWAKMPGREFPFYFRNQVYYSNYKVYLMVSKLEEYKDIVVVDLSKRLRDRYTMSPRVEEVVKGIEELVNDLSKSMEQLISINEHYKKLRERLLSLEVLTKWYGDILEKVLPQSIVLFSKHTPSKDVLVIDDSRGLRDIVGEVEEWKKAIGLVHENPSHTIDRMIRLVDEVERMYEYSKGYTLKTLNAVKAIVSLMHAHDVVKANPRLKSIIDRLMNTVEELGELSRLLVSRREFSYGELSLPTLKLLLEDVRDELRRVKKRIDELYDVTVELLGELRSQVVEGLRQVTISIGRLMPTLKSIASRIDGEVRELYEDVKSLVDECNRVMVLFRNSSVEDFNEYIESLEKTLKVYVTASRLDLEDIRRRMISALKNAGLDEDESFLVDLLLKSIAEGVDRITLRGLIEKAKKVIGVERSLSAFYRLVEKGLIDAEVVV